MKTSIGGDRLGSGNKQEISIRNFNRSTHDLSYIWRSSMSSGTLVPFMSELALPGDSFDIDLECDVKTLPTIGPLFGSYKVQLDVFECPIRLYQGKLHMNMLNIGMDMGNILLPQIEMGADYDPNAGDNQQVNSSAIYSYLNMRGLGRTSSGTAGTVARNFNAVPYLGYWEIYKQYYANKQEERGFVIHNGSMSNYFEVEKAQLTVTTTNVTVQDVYQNPTLIDLQGVQSAELLLILSWPNVVPEYGYPDVTGLTINIAGTPVLLTSVFSHIQVQGSVGNFTIRCTGYIGPNGKDQWEWVTQYVNNTSQQGLGAMQLVEFPLENIDTMKMDILGAVASPTYFPVNDQSLAPYGLGLMQDNEDNYVKLSSQEGLGIKTYQSDLFNNWISTEWIDGTNGVNEVSAVDTSGGNFTIDALNLANKVYNMLNRIALSGGTYDDWLSAQYTHDRAKGHESPIYHGSLIKELAFEEVISQADTENQQGEQQPLGTLAGRGRLTQKHKGGKVKIKVDEPSYIIAIASITPRIDYSQGNKWDVNLKNMNDLHVPSLDAIGFQDLVTDQMAWFDTAIDSSGNIVYNSAGKQPAWINYMTNVNQVRGSFAEEDNSMFMTLNRRYDKTSGQGIGDVTTYIDPEKFNNIFAETQLDSQNFWVQIGLDIKARRKMSAKVIPNL